MGDDETAPASVWTNPDSVFNELRQEDDIGFRSGGGAGGHANVLRRGGAGGRSHDGQTSFEAATRGSEIGG